MSAIRRIAERLGLQTVLSHPAAESIKTLPFVRRFCGKGWDRKHPFDRTLGTHTSGYVAANDLPSSPYDSQKQHGYAGSQPSVIRSALMALPLLNEYSFVDLGCGKGRPLLVASEFPFRDIIGVELSARLAGEARKNAAIVRRNFPGRTPIQIVTCDAGTYAFPAGNLVVFLYNPFGEEVIARVVKGIEASLAADLRTIFVVYYNPVFGAQFDASTVLTRYLAARLPYAEAERGYGSDLDDSVVVWRAGGTEPAHPNADAQIRVTKPAIRAEVDLPPKILGILTL